MNDGNLRQDNRGMTLVELLIAIVILAIITVPLLHAFVSSARINMDARKRLRLTTVAQDVMEGLRADSLAELAEEFNYPIPVGPYRGFHVINRSLVEGSISENRCSIDPDGNVTNLIAVDPASSDPAKTPSSVPGVSSVSHNFVPRDGSIASRNDGKFYFSMQDVKVENMGTPNYKVDVLIEVDATPYRSTARGGAGTVSNDTALHNDSKFVDIKDMSDKCDYMFYLDLERYLTKNCPGTGYTSKDVYSFIDLKLEPVVGGTGAKASISLSVYKASNMTLLFTEDLTPITRNETRNIYILYYPTYTHSSNPDKITFTNDTTENVNLCIVKQYDSTDADIRANLNDYERDYKCILTINDTGKRTVVRSNLDYNLYEIINNEGSLVKINEMSHSVSSAHIPAPAPQVTLNYPGIDPGDRDMYLTSLGGSVVTDRLYDVRVFVYEEGSIAAAGAGGSIDSGKLLTKIDGSIR